MPPSPGGWLLTLTAGDKSFIRSQIESLWRELDKIVGMLRRSSGREIETMANLDEVVSALEAQTTTVGGIETLLAQLKAALDAALANGLDQAKLDAVFAGLTSNTARLDAAILANTPAAPTP